ncbi:gliding motility-associated C-terminal domain-containing protein [uncultured Mucilaginibacter sp.]|uniref:T9SS type B sorting domain-containing protein n=1 Tax=uncultured Mucilaginibacter sp. TaxID=797541 RepID=UPI0026180DBB|nr:gliding motility-associated C-terminal domain-containing protein [uncultured Mucilaginibacter sp.]
MACISSQKTLLVILMVLFLGNVIAQVPNISYPTPQSYTINTAVTPLLPANTGGAVPNRAYGQVSTLTGNGYGNAVGSLASARFASPTGVALDLQGNIYIADRENNIIKKISSAGIVSVFAGSGAEGSADGIGPAATFYSPVSLTTDVAGNIYVADYGSSLIRKITPTGVVTTLAGSTPGFANGTGTAAKFGSPSGITVDKSGNVFVGDRDNNLIRKITPAGVVTTFAGSGTVGAVNGTGTAASFQHPQCLTFDNNENLYVTDFNSIIRKITPAGVVTTFAGSGVTGSTDGVGTAASFNLPVGITADHLSNIYVADAGNLLIRKITPAGVVTTLAGTGSVGFVNGIGKAASFSGLYDLTIDTEGNVYAADAYHNGAIRKISTTGYTIDKTLPAGLIFDSATGTINGTPIVLSPATDYTITAYNTSGSSTTVVNIKVENPAPLAFATLPSKNICDTDFDPAATSGIGTITYISSNSAVATIINNKIHVTGPGVTLITATDGSTSAQQNLTVISPVLPVVNITSDHNNICIGMPVTFTATVKNAGSNPTYQWQVNGIKVGINSPTFTTSNISPTDVVQCEVTNNDSCPVSSSSNKITGINADPYVTPTVSIISSATGPVCSGTEITFTATSTNGGTNPTYQWQVNGVNSGSNNPVFTNSNFVNGDIVTCMLTNNTGKCVAPPMVLSNTIKVNLIQPSNTSLSVIASANQVYTGTTVTFTALPVSIALVTSYQWQINGIDTGTNSATFTSKTLKTNDQIICTITVNDGCTITTVSSLPISVNILPSPTLNIPNTFTPNGDGINDYWNITALVYYPNCLVSIYNRYGSLVYQSKGYSKAWDGSINGSPLSVGTYYYVISLGSSSKKISGGVTIIR